MNSRMSVKVKAAPRKPPENGENDVWELRLYIAGHTPNSIAAIDNLKKICNEFFKKSEREME